MVRQTPVRCTRLPNSSLAARHGPWEDALENPILALQLEDVVVQQRGMAEENGVHGDEAGGLRGLRQAAFEIRGRGQGAVGRYANDRIGQVDGGTVGIGETEHFDPVAPAERGGAGGHFDAAGGVLDVSHAVVKIGHDAGNFHAVNDLGLIAGLLEPVDGLGGDGKRIRGGDLIEGNEFRSGTSSRTPVNCLRSLVVTRQTPCRREEESIKDSRWPGGKSKSRSAVISPPGTWILRVRSRRLRMTP